MKIWNSALGGRRLTLVLLAGVLFWPACTRSVKPELAADTVLINGKILTVDENDSVVEALAMKDGKILSVGSNEVVSALAGPDTRVFDLAGATATPGATATTPAAS